MSKKLQAKNAIIESKKVEVVTLYLQLHLPLPICAFFVVPDCVLQLIFTWLFANVKKSFYSVTSN